jgi:hypothetical protein
MNFRKSLPLLAAGAFVLAGLATVPARASAAGANLVANGGFETGDLGGWTEVGNTGYGAVACGGAPEGDCEAFFGPVGSLGGIAQSVATTAGGEYAISFVLNSDGGTPGEFRVDFGSQTLLDLANPPAAGDQTFTFDAFAGGAASILQIQFQDDTGFMFLDDVRVSAVPVPEPAGIALMGAGLLGLAAVRRRRTP